MNPDCMKTRFITILFLILALAACVPSGPAAPETQLVTVYATPAAEPWLTELFDCAGKFSVVIHMTDPASAEMILQIGEPKELTSPAYQFDAEELWIVTHRESPLQNMTVEEVRALFAGQGDPSMQVWVYPPGEDMQIVFEQAVMSGRSVTPLAGLAVSPGQMSEALTAGANTVGILPKHWDAGGLRSIHSISNVPVLAIAKTEPNAAWRNLIACLQK